MTPKFTAVQHYDATNETRMQFDSLPAAQYWITAHCMIRNPLAQYTIYRKSTSRVVMQWERGAITIDNRMHRERLERWLPVQLNQTVPTPGTTY